MLQGETANAALAKIAQYILTIEGQMRSTSLSQQIAERGFAPANKFELMKLLYVAPQLPRLQPSTVTARLAFMCPVFARFFLTKRRIIPNPRLFYRQDKAPLFLVRFISSEDPSHTSTIAVPIEEFPGSVIGVLQAEANLSYIWEMSGTCRSVRPAMLISWPGLGT